MKFFRSVNQFNRDVCNILSIQPSDGSIKENFQNKLDITIRSLRHLIIGCILDKSNSYKYEKTTNVLRELKIVMINVQAKLNLSTKELDLDKYQNKLRDFRLIIITSNDHFFFLPMVYIHKLSGINLLDSPSSTCSDIQTRKQLFRGGVMECVTSKGITEYKFRERTYSPNEDMLTLLNPEDKIRQELDNLFPSLEETKKIAKIIDKSSKLNIDYSKYIDRSLIALDF